MLCFLGVSKLDPSNAAMYLKVPAPAWHRLSSEEWGQGHEFAGARISLAHLEHAILEYAVLDYAAWMAKMQCLPPFRGHPQNATGAEKVVRGWRTALHPE